LDILAILTTKILSFFTGLFGKGTSGPGKIALKISATVLKTLGSRFKIILITGTNGKTTTSAMLSNILRQSGKKVISNESGANLKAGIVSSLAKGYPLIKPKNEIYAVLEVDEAYARFITAEVSPVLIAVTNIFRDQLDRYGEVDTTLQLIYDACKNAPEAILVLNADEAMFGNLLPENRRVFYGFDIPVESGAVTQTNAEGMFCKNCKTAYEYNFITFSHLGDYRCPSCGMKRPKLDVCVNKILNITPEESDVVMGSLHLNIPQPGVYNIYNALCAVACSAVLGADENDMQNGIRLQESRFGRQETIKIDSKEIRLILIKNPAGALEAINSVLPDTSSVDFGILLSDNFADGTDVSWIYDVEFEKLKTLNHQNILVGGTRVFDMAVRLKCGEFDIRRFLICEDFDTLIYNIRTKASNRTYLFTTYTAMITLRKYLRKKGYIKKLWN
jgi:UDP-N-acetylmuramyl tripeptide synthase